MGLVDLRRKIETHEATLAVIGLGYVGLPLACAFADAGFSVIGVDVKADRVALINSGRSPIEGNEPGLSELLEIQVGRGRLRATTQYAALREIDVVFINVETPVDSDHMPGFEALKAVCAALGPVLCDGGLVIVESTIAPGTIDRIVRPMLEESSGRLVNEGFYLGHCPERVMPGKLLSNLHNLSRVCGGSSLETAEVMVRIYGQIVTAELDPSDCVTAELVKTAENAYRDVNIAFANELALACEATGGDFLRVRELVNKSPGRAILMAGAGVGGHCIPKDSWLLAHGVGGRMPMRLLSAARMANDYMPSHMANLAGVELHRAGRNTTGAKIAVLGYAYLENSDDTRNSPSAVLVSNLQNLGSEVAIHDPRVPEYQGDVWACLQSSDAAVLMVAHNEYRSLDLHRMKVALRTPILIDGRRVFDAQRANEAGLIYRAVGLGVKPT